MKVFLSKGRFICTSLSWPVLVSNAVELEWQVDWLNAINYYWINQLLTENENGKGVDETLQNYFNDEIFQQDFIMFIQESNLYTKEKSKGWKWNATL